MRRKVVLSQVLTRLAPPLPADLEAKARRMLQELTKSKEEKIVKKKISLGLVLALALVLLLMGVALALTQLGIWDFLDEGYGQTPLPEAVEMVQTEFEEATYALGEASVTLKEAVSDGLVGSIVVEYRTPEGTYLYAPDSMQRGDPVIYGEQITPEEVFKKYGTYYHAMDEHIGVVVNGQEQPLRSEYGYEQVKTGNNAMTVHISFSLLGVDPKNLVYSPGVFKMESTDFEQRQRQEAFIPLKLTLNADKNETVVPELSDAAKAAGIKAVSVTRTPLVLAVKVQFEEYAYDFRVQNEKGEELARSFLSYFAVLEGKADNSFTQGYAPVESLPDTLYIQTMRKGANGEELVGEPVAVQLR